MVPPEDDWEKDDPWDTGPLKVSLGAAILPFRDGDHKPQNGLKAAVQAKYGSGSFPHEVNGPNKQKKYFEPPQDVIKAAKNRFPDNADIKEWAPRALAMYAMQCVRKQAPVPWRAFRSTPTT